MPTAPCSSPSSTSRSISLPLRLGRRTVVAAAHGAPADSAVAEQDDAVDGGADARDGLRVAVHALPVHVHLAALLRDERFTPPVFEHGLRAVRRDRVPAVAVDERRDALAHELLEHRIGEHEDLFVRVRVDEAGADELAARVDRPGAPRCRGCRRCRRSGRRGCRWLPRRRARPVPSTMRPPRMTRSSGGPGDLHTRRGLPAVRRPGRRCPSSAVLRNSLRDTRRVIGRPPR